jgi:hypothetical protein
VLSSYTLYSTTTDTDILQVTPYNLWAVRFLRYLTVFAAMINFIWWILLFVSIFVTPPGLNTPGSGYTDFAYVTLTMGNLLITLLFFSLPSAALRISMSIVSVLLIVDMIIILAVSQIRHEESWPGIASIIWAVVISLHCITTDRVVAWGKKAEEERLTGRPETRRSLKQWLAALVETVIVWVYIVIVALMTMTLVLRALDAGLEPDGDLIKVDGNKYSVHLACFGNITTDSKTGAREPTILLEAGEEPSEYDFEHWAYAAYMNGTINRYCYWDRPGYAWSDDAPSPHSAGMSADALSEALAIQGEEGPWITVSAGYGSIVSRIFTSRHVKDVVGTMLVDPLHEDLLDRVGGAFRGFRLWGFGVVAPIGFPSLIGAIFNGRSREDRTYGRSVWHTGKFLKAKLQENLVATSLTKNEVVAATNIISDVTPLVVISSGIEVRRDTEWGRKQEDITKKGKLIAFDVVNKAPHQVWATYEGREMMEKRLAELIKAAKDIKLVPEQTEEELKFVVQEM